MKRQALLLNFYHAMLAELGPSHWWPGQTPFEIALGAILTQNTNWTNVEKALHNLRSSNVLQPDALNALGDDELETLIRPAGFFRIKTKRIRSFLRFLGEESAFEMDLLRFQDMNLLRDKLLETSGIGPETADSILLYALSYPSFVVDAYTWRILTRHALIPEDATYDEIRSLFMDALPEDVSLFQEYHALLVRTAQGWCYKKKPLCSNCPLEIFIDGNLDLSCKN